MVGKHTVENSDDGHCLPSASTWRDNDPLFGHSQSFCGAIA